jgi:hypothetical protein
MLGQERAKSDHRLFAAPRGHEHHRLVGTVEIDEHGHISLSALGRGLIQADGGNLAEVEALDGAAKDRQGTVAQDRRAPSGNGTDIILAGSSIETNRYWVQLIQSAPFLSAAKRRHNIVESNSWHRSK